jgi:membrane protein
LVDLIRRVLREQSAEQVGLAASGAAFWLVITVLPTAIAAVSVYGLVVSPQQVAKDLAGLANGGPQSLGSTLTQQLQKVAAADRVGLTAGLAVSAVLALWTASAGVYNLERSIRAAYGLRPEEYVRARGRALVGALVVVLTVGFVALVSTAATIVVDYLPVVVVVVLGVPLVVATVAVVIATLYRFSIGPVTAARRLMPGSLAASVCLLLVVGGFAVYLRLSTRYTAVYGALAGTVIGMIGTYLGVYVVLIGAVLNAQLGPNSRVASCRPNSTGVR